MQNYLAFYYTNIS